MYVEIHARSEVDDESTGKSMWVNVDPEWLKMKLARTKPDHLDSPPWHIEIKATRYLERSSGARGGEYKGVIRTLEVHLTPDDISAIVDLALAKGLLTLEVKGKTVESKK